jgi:hypothetical protein
MSLQGHRRRFMRMPRTSASPPIPDILLRCAARRQMADARRGATVGRELRRVAGAAASVAPHNKARRACSRRFTTVRVISLRRRAILFRGGAVHLPSSASSFGRWRRIYMAIGECFPTQSRDCFPSGRWPKRPALQAVSRRETGSLPSARRGRGLSPAGSAKSNECPGAAACRICPLPLRERATQRFSNLKPGEGKRQEFSPIPSPPDSRSRRRDPRPDASRRRCDAAARLECGD